MPKPRQHRRRPPVTQPDWDRRRLIITLRNQGLTFQEIANQLGITRPSVHQTYFAAVRDIALEHHEQAVYAWSDAIERENEVVEAARKQLISACRRCLGNQKVEPYLYRDKDGEVVLKGEAVMARDAEGLILCPPCKGSGYLYSPFVRQGAMALMQRSNEHFFTLHGLERIAKESSADRWDLSDEVMAMSPDDIAREAQAFLAEFVTVRDPVLDKLTGRSKVRKPRAKTKSAAKPTT